MIRRGLRVLFWPITLYHWLEDPIPDEPDWDILR